MMNNSEKRIFIVASENNPPASLFNSDENSMQLIVDREMRQGDLYVYEIDKQGNKIRDIATRTNGEWKHFES